MRSSDRRAPAYRGLRVAVSPKRRLNEPLFLFHDLIKIDGASLSGADRAVPTMIPRATRVEISRPTAYFRCVIFVATRAVKSSVALNAAHNDERGAPLFL